MAKRDRDTGIWNDKFYRDLPVLYKCFWDYLNDECDNCGVWIVDWKVARIKIGKKVEPETALSLYGDRIQVFDFGNKWHVKTFISEKLGFAQLNPAHKFQKSIMDLLAKHKIQKNGVYPDTLQSVMSIGKDKGNGKWEGKDKDTPEENESFGYALAPDASVKLEEDLIFAFDERYMSDQRGKWPHLDFDFEFRSFCEKVRGSPDEYRDHDGSGLRLAFQYQLRSSKNKIQPNGTAKTTNRNISHVASVAEDFARRHGSKQGSGN